MPKQNKPINPLLVAGGTLLFYMCAIPIADAFSTWVQTAIGAKVAKIQYVLAQDQQETEEIADRINGSEPVHAIGFQIPSESEEYYEED